jgi:hypothetical protein
MIIQDISEGSPLYTLYRGWSERRVVQGLPIYKYTKDGFESVESINDASIREGANLQSTDLWNSFFTTGALPWVFPPANEAETYNNTAPTAANIFAFARSVQLADLSPVRRLPDESGPFLTGAAQPGDIIGPWLVEDHLTRLKIYRWKRGLPLETTQLSYSGSGAATTCSQSISAARSDFSLRLSDVVSYNSASFIRATVRQVPTGLNHSGQVRGFAENGRFRFAPLKAFRAELLMAVSSSSTQPENAGPYAVGNRGYVVQAFDAGLLSSGEVSVNGHEAANIPSLVDPWAWHGVQCDPAEKDYTYAFAFFVRHNFYDLN